ncbi:hypothetical protein [Flavobacterium chungangense]|uniref:Uncharacterized protein n=1 Tax=Flavobacterium chungangense TaxID=554283 RepID=A0A6V6Z2W3_9FLAO|nr:hypothetical protein [Flavobacterium chungangense]CAD0005936.1 hypothetical protein FLACHUCJ7_02578 [Flavobacterium chungangense]
MIDLTRRNFIKNVGFIGATTLFCGSSLLAQNTFGSFSDFGNENENILSQFSKSSCTDVFLSDSALLECYKNAAFGLEKTGYKLSGNFCYNSADNQLKMFPMHLLVDGSGKLDDVLLCLGKNSNGEWNSLRSLSGFDLEAISMAMKELSKKNNAADLTQYLLPAPVKQVNPYGFETKRGSVFLKTHLSDNHTSIEMVVTEGSHVVFQKEIISRHNFTVNSILV